MSQDPTNCLICRSNSFGLIPLIWRYYLKFFPIIFRLLIQITHLGDNSNIFKMRIRNTYNNHTSSHRVRKINSFAQFASTNSKVYCSLFVNLNKLFNSYFFLSCVFCLYKHTFIFLNFLNDIWFFPLLMKLIHDVITSEKDQKTLRHYFYQLY